MRACVRHNTHTCARISQGARTAARASLLDSSRSVVCIYGARHRRAAAAEISKCNDGARMEGGFGRDALEPVPLLAAEAPPPMSQQQPATPPIQSLPQPPAHPRTQQQPKPSAATGTSAYTAAAAVTAAVKPEPSARDTAAGFVGEAPLRPVSHTILHGCSHEGERGTAVKGSVACLCVRFYKTNEDAIRAWTEDCLLTHNTGLLSESESDLGLIFSRNLNSSLAEKIMR